MGHRMFEEAMKFVFSRKTIFRVYHEYRASGKTSDPRHRCGRKKIWKQRAIDDFVESTNEMNVQNFSKF